MSTRNDGGEAFPRSKGSNEYAIDHGAPGMSLRDYFAAAAISPMLIQAYGQVPAVLAQKAYQIADAMLRARQSEPPVNNRITEKEKEGLL